MLPEELYRAAAAVAVGVALTYFMYRHAVATGPKSRLPHLSDAFPLSQIVSESRLKALSFAYSLPITVPLALIAYLAVDPFAKARTTTLNSLRSMATESVKNEGFRDFLVHVLGWLDGVLPKHVDPLIVVAAAFILFYPHINLFTRWYFSKILKVVDLYDTVDSIAINAARKLLADQSHSDLERSASIASQVPRLPRPANLAELARPDNLFAYQLVYCARAETPHVGLRRAIDQFVEKLDAPKSVSIARRSVQFDLGTYKRGALLFIVGCWMYWYLAPKVRFFWAMPTSFGWPDVDTYARLGSALVLAQSAALFALPFIFGTYAARSILGTGRYRKFRRFAGVKWADFVAISLFTGFAFHLLRYYLVKLGYFGRSQDYNLLDVDSITYIVGVSFVPVCALAVWVRLVLFRWTHSTPSWVLHLVLILLCGLLFSLAQMMTEQYEVPQNWAVHHFVMGTYIMASIFLCFPSTRIGAHEIERERIVRAA
jgi:hypothetical protein